MGDEKWATRNGRREMGDEKWARNGRREIGGTVGREKQAGEGWGKTGELIVDWIQKLRGVNIIKLR
jgi:hypothetical protein